MVERKMLLLLSAYCVDSIDRRKTGLTVLDLGEIIVSARIIHKLGQLQSNLDKNLINSILYRKKDSKCYI